MLPKRRSTMTTWEEYELRCEVLASLRNLRRPLTEEQAARRYGVSVAEIGAWLEALRLHGGKALVPHEPWRVASF